MGRLKRSYIMKNNLIVFLILMSIILISVHTYRYNNFLLSYSETIAKKVIENYNEINNLKKELKNLNGQLNRIKYNSNITVTVTAYSACEEECNPDHKNTACMRIPKKGDIAVSRDLFEHGWTFGKMVYISNIGVYRINDLMNKRFTNSIDIFIDSKIQAKKFGKIITKASLIL